MKRHFILDKFFYCVFVVVAVLVVWGCSKSSQSNLQDGQAQAIIAPQSAPAGQPIALSLVGGFSSATWSFVSDETQTPISPTCTWQNNGLSGTCTFVPSEAGSGKIDITVKGMNGGNQTTVTGSIEVILPQSAASLDTIVAEVEQNGSVISTISSEGTSTGAPQVTMNKIATIDFSHSITTGPVSFDVDFGDGSNPVVLNPGEFTVQHTYASPGQYSLVVQSSGDGASGNLTVLMQVMCDSTVPPVQIASMTVTPISDNYYNFAVTATGGSGTYSTIWSPDGTGVTRSPTVQGLTFKYFVDYVGSRNVEVEVNDVYCQTITTFNQAVNFAIPTANGVPGQLQGPQVGGLTFLQGKIADTQGIDTRTNGFLSLLQAPSDPPPMRVGGYYSLNPDGSADFRETAATPINDNQDGIDLQATFSTSGVMTITNVTVSISGGVDASSALMDSYTTSSCISQGTVTTLMGASCNGQSTASGYTVDYTYSCPTLTDSQGKTMSLQQGAGFFTQTIQDPCGTGGGGGGGSHTGY